MQLVGCIAAMVLMACGRPDADRHTPDAGSCPTQSAGSCATKEPAIFASCPNPQFSARVFTGSQDDSWSTNQFAAGDLDGDGTLDVVMADTSTTVSVRLGDPSGNFGSPTSYVVPSYAREVALGDLNADGRMDVVVLSTQFHSGMGGALHVLFNQGGGVLSLAAATYPTPEGPVSLAIGDLDSDGRPDVAVTNDYGAEQVSVFPNLGNGTFGNPTTYATSANGYQTLNIGTGDLNGDGRLDIVAVNSNNTVSLLIRKASGGYTLDSFSFTTGATANSYALAISDLNNDAVLDIAVGYTSLSDLSGVRVFINSGDASFAPQPLVVADHPDWLAVEDVDRDGDRDLVVAQRDALTLLMNSGTGAFTVGPSYVTNSRAAGLTVADFDGNGTSDVLISTGHLLVFDGAPDGTLIASTRISGVEPHGPIAAADLNDDDQQDIVVITDGGLVTVLGSGDGTFMTSFETVLAAPNEFAIADLNGDGLDDIAVVLGTAFSPDSHLAVLFGTGSGSLSAPNLYTVGLGARTLAIGDLTGDCKPDIVVGGTGRSGGHHVPDVPGERNVFLNTGNGAFMPSAPEAGSRSFVNLGDLNRDGVLDLYETGPGFSHWLLGVGNGTFGEEVVVQGGYNDVVDLNDDDIPDLLAATPGGTSVSLGNCDGTYQPAITNALQAFERITVVDINGDQAPDLVSAFGPVVVAYGHGDGTFSTPTQILAGAVAPRPWPAAVADFNGDGLADLATTVISSTPSIPSTAQTSLQHCRP